MNILNALGITDAHANAPATTTTTAVPTSSSPAPAAQSPSTTNGILSLLPTLLIFVAVFYFLFIRPQTKRNKDHRKLIEGLVKDDEVVTSGGVVGKIARMADNFIVLNVSNDVEMTFQKNAIAGVLPRGTLKSF